MVVVAMACLVPRAEGANLILGTNETPVATNFTSGTNAFDNTYIGYASNSAGNSLDILNAGTLLTNVSDMFVGYLGSGNSLVVSNGGKVFNEIGYVGTASSFNSAFVTGAGSEWVNRSVSLNIGYYGDSNILVVSNGGYVSSVEGWIGNSGTGNAVLVIGAGSLWSNSLSVCFGWNGGNGSRLTIADGGMVANSAAYLGGSGASSNDVVLVTGAGSLWTNSSSVYVGYSGAGNGLAIQNGALTAANGDCYAGYNAGSSNNEISVTGTNSALIVGGLLQVGHFGSGNRLVVSDGGLLAAQTNVSIRNTQLGASASSSNNLLRVAGAGSLFTNGGDFYVGGEGSGNMLVVSNQGTVAVAGSQSFIGYASNSVLNTATITGTNSVWTNSGALYVGGLGRSNSLIVGDGAMVAGATATIGGSNSAYGNSAIVTGSSSLWANSSDLYVGNYGSGNNLTVSNQGSLTVGGTTYIGAASSNNTLTVTAANSTWTNAGSVYVGKAGSGNSLVIAESAKAVTAGGAGVYIGYEAAAHGNSVTVGSGALWSNAVALSVGYFGSSNSLEISGGGQAINPNGYVGLASNAVGNRVSVNGSDSEWINTGDFFMGAQGAQSRLVVSNGGTVSVAGANSYLGFGANAHESVAVVTGTNSLWTNAYEFGVGHNARSVSLAISDGGVVASSNGYVGGNFASVTTNASANTVTITGAGSLWTNRAGLYVGYRSPGNTVTVLDGGAARAEQTQAGVLASSTGNQVLVSGAGSILTNSQDLTIGVSGGGNSLVVSNGARVVAGNDSYLGFNTNSSGNEVSVTGTNSALIVGGLLQVGHFGSGNRLVVSDGGLLAAHTNISIRNTQLGAAAGSSNNALIVTGPGSLFTNGGDFYVGGAGSLNTLIISNQGAVAVTGPKSYIGHDTNSVLNAVIITGTNSSWKNSGILYVGTHGQSNSLNVTGGGLFSGATVYIGESADASGNSVVVDGTGSVWTNSGALYIGYSGSNSSVIVANGGSLGAASVTIAAHSGSGGLLEIGTSGGSDAAGTISAPSVAFGAGSGAINFNQTNAFTFSAAVSGAGVVRQLGTGTTILSGSNSYTGTTEVGSGTLLVDGNQSGATGAVSVSGDATLGGSGILGGTITLSDGATLSPGNSPGVLTAAAGLVFEAGSTFVWELTGNTAAGRGTSFDGVDVAGGALSITSGVASSLVFNVATSTVSWVDDFWDSDRTWLVFSNSNSPLLGSSDVFSTIVLSTDAGSLVLTNVEGRQNASFSWQLVGNDVYLNYNSVPEPSTLTLVLITAVLGLGVFVVRRAGNSR